MVHGSLAEDPEQVLSIARWKEQVMAPEFLLDDREDISDSRNSFFYEDKRSFRPDGIGVRSTSAQEDVGLRQPRLVTRVRFAMIREDSPCSWIFLSITSTESTEPKRIAA